MDPFTRGFIRGIEEKAFDKNSLAHYLSTFGNDMLALFAQALRGKDLANRTLHSRVNHVMNDTAARQHLEHFAIFDAIIKNLTGQESNFYKRACELWETE